MRDECHPKPQPTCQEHADSWLEKYQVICDNQADAADKEICHEKVLEYYTNWSNHCEVEDCKERNKDELEPQFNSCFQIEDPDEMQECLDNLDIELEQMAQECGNPSPTCHE